MKQKIISDLKCHKFIIVIRRSIKNWIWELNLVKKSFIQQSLIHLMRWKLIQHKTQWIDKYIFVEMKIFMMRKTQQVVLKIFSYNRVRGFMRILTWQVVANCRRVEGWRNCSSVSVVGWAFCLTVFYDKQQVGLLSILKFMQPRARMIKAFYRKLISVKSSVKLLHVVVKNPYDDELDH